MADPVVIQAGTTVQFPVPSEHPLASYQQILPVNQVADLHDLAVVRNLKNLLPNISAAELTNHVSGILGSAGASGVLRVSLPDVTVEAGATLTFSGPISQMVAGTVTVLGRVIAYGSFNLTCSELTGVGPVQAQAVTLSPQ
jgi:hypothetical protein